MPGFNITPPAVEDARKRLAGLMGLIP